MLQGGDQVLAMALRQVRRAGLEGSDESTDAIGGPGRARFTHLQKRLQRQADDIGIPASEALGRAPERLAQVGRQPNGHLVLHAITSLHSIVMQMQCETAAPDDTSPIVDRRFRFSAILPPARPP